MASCGAGVGTRSDEVGVREADKGFYSRDDGAAGHPGDG